MSGLLVAERALRDRRTSSAWWALGTGLYVAMILAVWPVLADNEEFEELAGSYPEVLQSMFGGSDAFAAITTPTGFLATYVFAMILPVLLAALAVTTATGLLAGEDDDGLLDLLLGHPVSRRRVVLEKALAVGVVVLLVAAVVVVLIALGREPVDLDVGVAGVLAATLGSFLYAAVHGALALALGGLGLRSGMVAGVTWGVIVGGYLMTVLADLVEGLEPLEWFAPLHHATAGEPLVDGPPPNLVVLVAVTVVLVAVAVVGLSRRDLR